MDKMIIWGGTGQAIVLEELLSYAHIRPAAVFENNEEVVSPFPGVKIFYKEEGFKKWFAATPDASSFFFLIAIGGNNGKVRQSIGKMLQEYGLKPYTAIHPKAFVAVNALIGEGSQILAGSCVCARAKVGEYCIINTGAGVDHECIIGDNVHIGPGAKLAGCIKVGDNVFIGTNATILPGLVVGENALIGAGAVVIRDVPANCTVAGNPARIINTGK